MKLQTRSLIVLLVLAAVTACNDSTPTSPVPVIAPVGAAAGTYALDRYNGEALPVIQATNIHGQTFAVWSGKLVLGDDHSYVRTIISGPDDAMVKQVETGSFRLVESTLTFYPSNKARENGYIGQLANGAITYGAGSPNVTYSFHR